MNRKLFSCISAIATLAWKNTYAGGFQILGIAALTLVIEAPAMILTKDDRTLMPSVRVQVACILSWMILLTWGVVKASILGGEQQRGNMAMFWNCLGVPKCWRFLATVFPVVCAAAFTSASVGLVYFGAFGWDWGAFIVASQYVIFAVIIASGLFFFAFGLSTAVSPSAAAVISVLLAIYANYGVQVIGLLRGKSQIMTAIWTCSPQIWMGDLTQRLVFNWGALGAYEFLCLGSYCLTWSCVFAFIGFVIFKHASGGSK